MGGGFLVLALRGFYFGFFFFAAILGSLFSMLVLLFRFFAYTYTHTLAEVVEKVQQEPKRQV